jgi:hypothetical protein
MNPQRNLFSRALAFHRTAVAWLGAEYPVVPPATVMVRANACAPQGAGKGACPHNVNRPIYELLTAPAAEELRRRIEIKDQRAMHTSLDPLLHVCELCGCHLATKVWEPIELAKADFPVADAPEWCWVKRESPTPSIV